MSLKQSGVFFLSNFSISDRARRFELSLRPCVKTTSNGVFGVVSCDPWRRRHWSVKTAAGYTQKVDLYKNVIIYCSLL